MYMFSKAGPLIPWLFPVWRPHPGLTVLEKALGEGTRQLQLGEKVVL